MRATERFWAVATLGILLASLAVLFAAPIVLVGALGVGAWVIAAQVAFVREVERIRSAVSVERETDAAGVMTDQPIQITLEATIETETSSTLALSNPLPKVFAHTDGHTGGAISASQSLEQSFVIEAPVAGTFHVPSPVLEITEPIGLFTESLGVGEPLSIRVDPRTPRSIHIGMGGDRIAAAYGEHDAETGQGGIDPAELRRYVPGDPAKNVDWKATARRAEPYVREREPQTDQYVSLVVDHRASMADGPAGQRQLDFGREVALAYLDGARRYDDPIALQTVGDAGITTNVAAGTTTEHYNRIAERLHSLSPTGDSGEYAVAVRTGAATAHRRATSLSGDTAFEQRLRPYMAAANPYVERVADDPLVEAIGSTVTRTNDRTLFVVVTDTERRAELQEALRTISAANDRALVFVLPDVVFESQSAATLDDAYRRYVDFEQYRKTLDGLPGISVFEVAPQDRLATILQRSAGGTRGVSP